MAKGNVNNAHTSRNTRRPGLSFSVDDFAYREVMSQLVSFRTAWQSPSDTLSILMVIGGDIVLKALAQVSGRPFAPVAFSFGWVAYAFNTLTTIFGERRLMPKPDHTAKIINTQTGYVRENKSWVLGRLLRDFEHPLPDGIGLCVTIFEATTDEHIPAGVPTIDWCWSSGVVVSVLQIAIAAIPGGLNGDWSILLITSAGALLALLTGTLPQWRQEKWACRRNTNKTVALTSGNGSRHVMVVIGKGVGLDLEDLATGEAPQMRRGARTWSFVGLPVALLGTQLACVLFAASWFAFLITVTSVNENTWYLLAVGGLGMIQNVAVAGMGRGMGTTGIHLRKIDQFEEKKAMHVLMDVEEAYPFVGRSLLSEYFPGSLRLDEKDWWNGKKGAYEESRRSKPKRKNSIATTEIIGRVEGA